MAVLNRMMADHHRRLAAEKVRVAVLMIHPPVNKDGDKIGPAIKHAGVEVAGRIKVATARERVLAEVEAIMEIDAEFWDTLVIESQAALIDHELEHLVILIDKEGVTRRHPGNLPVLATQPDDWMLTGFRSVVDRHGAHALEAMAIRELYEGFQMVFEFMGDGGDAAETPKRKNTKTKKRGAETIRVTHFKHKLTQLAPVT